MEKQMNNVFNSTSTVNGSNKLSYEELSNVCNKLQNKCNQLLQQLFQMQQQQVLARLEFLFKVLDKKENFDTNFVSTCIKEIVTLMTINKEEDKVENKETNKSK